MSYQLGDPTAEQKPEAVLRVQRVEQGADLRPQLAAHQHGLRADQGDLGAQATRGGGDLGAEHAVADHHRA